MGSVSKNASARAFGTKVVHRFRARYRFEKVGSAPVPYTDPTLLEGYDAAWYRTAISRVTKLAPISRSTPSLITCYSSSRLFEATESRASDGGRTTSDSAEPVQRLSSVAQVARASRRRARPVGELVEVVC